MKAIFRNFRVTVSRFRLASALNVLGLGVAFAAFIIILIRVDYEYTFDTAYKKSGRIYRVESTLVPAGAGLSSREAYTSFCARPLMEMMIPSVPQIESYAIMYSAPSEGYVKYETAAGEQAGMMMPFRMVSPGILEVFDMEIVEGDVLRFAEPGQALLPESLARKMYGEAPAAGRRIVRSDGSSLTVGGVYRDFPENTGIGNDVKINLGDAYRNDWTEWALLLFVALARDASPDEAAGILTDFFEKTGMGKQMGISGQTSFRLNPVEEIYYRHDTSLDIAPKGNRTMTGVLLLIAWLVVVIAAINFINFSTALMPARIKSINTRKILGESTARLRVALVFEALGICLAAYLLALGIVSLFNAAGFPFLLPASAGIGEKWLPAFLLACGTGLVAGVYPAFYMTSFQPALLLKGTFGVSPAGRRLRVILTGFQFMISTGLIITVFFIRLQNRYMYNMEGTMNDRRIATVSLDRDLMAGHADRLVETLKSDPSVEDVAFSDWPVGFLDYYPYTYSKSPENEDMMYYFLPVSYNFPEMAGLKMTAGRGFEKTDVSMPEERLILNELAARQFGVKPGDRLANGSLVIGIVEDFHFMNLRRKIEPVALTVKQFQNGALHPSIYVRTDGNAGRAVKQIKAAIAEIDPLYPVDIRFYDRLFEEAYGEERKTSAQITLFCLLAVIISLMGVFGLVTFETQYRRKEISLRKVMGATGAEILWLFNRKFARIIAVCFLPAASLAWYGTEQWLQSFACRIPLYWWVFVLSPAAVWAVTFITVTVQCRQVAAGNPADYLKCE
ncbi:MAG: ABC transporter permease [Tannerella sp.]|jgi:putative ABC transport system permease protein|nr:ABC transporter permease [Tannerella sp.]